MRNLTKHLIHKDYADEGSRDGESEGCLLAWSVPSVEANVQKSGG